MSEILGLGRFKRKAAHKQNKDQQYNFSQLSARVIATSVNTPHARWKLSVQAGNY
ncbi:MULTISPECIES: hypothetical protein [Xenorhabdus]|uniref:hypothetical protein n=1 Tax=Xenorhabdus TaxID=626 RepID=UPI00142DA2F7|nr:MULTISPECIES: hypothetical protein [Xenorhabdus]